jgi:hypothetical protein
LKVFADHSTFGDNRVRFLGHGPNAAGTRALRGY